MRVSRNNYWTLNDVLLIIGAIFWGFEVRIFNFRCLWKSQNQILFGTIFCGWESKTPTFLILSRTGDAMTGLAVHQTGHALLCRGVAVYWTEHGLHCRWLVVYWIGLVVHRKGLSVQGRGLAKHQRWLVGLHRGPAVQKKRTCMSYL